MIGKLLSQALITFLAMLGPMLIVGPLDTIGWINVILMGAGILLVGIVPNLTGGVAKYSKLIISAVITVLTLVISYLADNMLSTEEIIQLIIAAAGAFGVYQFKAPQWGAQFGSRVVPEQRLP